MHRNGSTATPTPAVVTDTGLRMTLSFRRYAHACFNVIPSSFLLPADEIECCIEVRRNQPYAFGKVNVRHIEKDQG
jgi:hypothetical protein